MTWGVRKNPVRAGRLLAFGLCGLVAIYLLSGLNPQIEIFTLLIQTTFAGLAALTPATLARLYTPRVGKTAAIISILVGEALVVLLRLKVIPTFGFVDGIIVLLAAFITLGMAVWIGKIITPLRRQAAQ